MLDEIREQITKIEEGDYSGPNGDDYKSLRFARPKTSCRQTRRTLILFGRTVINLYALPEKVAYKQNNIRNKI